MPPGELERIRAAAVAEGLTTSEWIRNACTAALGRPTPMHDRAQIIELLASLRRTLDEAELTVKACRRSRAHDIALEGSARSLPTPDWQSRDHGKRSGGGECGRRRSGSSGGRPLTVTGPYRRWDHIQWGSKLSNDDGNATIGVFWMAVTNMYEVFSHELADIYDAEHRLLEHRTKRVQSVSNQELADAMREDLSRAEGRIANVEKAFERLEEQPWRETCQATQGLIEEARAGIGETDGGPVRDLMINVAMIKEELYKTAVYRSLINSVRSLEGDQEGVPLEGREEIASVLEDNLRQSEQAAQDAEQNVPDLSDAAKKAGAFHRVRPSDR